MRRFFIVFTAVLFLSACGNVGGINLANYTQPDETRDEFVMCHGYSCSAMTYAWFTPKQWQSIELIFKKHAKTSEEERSQIATAIASMERYSALLIGTQNDQAKAPLIKKSAYELDCVDETVNSSKYLKFLDEADLLKYHTVGRPSYRGLGTNFMYPHNTATIIERATGTIYAVDSYVYANAEKPDIRLLDVWRNVRI